MPRARILVREWLRNLSICVGAIFGLLLNASREAIVRNGAVYFAAVGGAGALLSKAVKKAEVIAYDDLGTEAIRKLEVENLPAIVVIDSEGSYLYEDAAKKDIL